MECDEENDADEIKESSTKDLTMRRLQNLVGSIALVVAVSFTQTVRHVPQGYATIQAAVDAAVNGDTVLVAEGTYFVNLTVAKKIVLGSLFILDGDTAHISRTILDGSLPRNVDSASVLLLLPGSDTSTVISGFTIRGGTGTRTWVASSGVYYQLGGGILCVGGTGTIVRNVITQNVLGTAYSRGAGVCLWGTNPYVRIHSNRIVWNRSAGSSIGLMGGVSFSGPGELVNNIIAYNYSTLGPGGLSCSESAGPSWIVHNTIAHNSALAGNEGVSITATGVTYLVNNILWNPGEGVDLRANDVPLTAAHNLVRGWFYGENNFSEDPMFLDTLAFTLSAESPAISAGLTSGSLPNAAFVVPPLDVHGSPRPLIAGSAPDLGAVESPFSNPHPSIHPQRLTVRNLVSSGITRRYFLYTPGSYETSTRLPLLVMLHGAGGTGEGMLREGFHLLAERYGFLAAFPDGTSLNWQYSDSLTSDMRFLNDLLDTLAQRFKADPQRIFLGGYSNGARMTFSFASYYGRRLRAIAPYAMGLSRSLPPIRTPLPMIYFVGTLDGNYGGNSTLYSAEETAAVFADYNRTHGPVLFTTMPDIDPADDGTVRRYVYASNESTYAPVHFYAVDGGGHNLPGAQSMWGRPVNRDINGPELICSFFDVAARVAEPAQHTEGAASGSVYILVKDSSKKTNHHYRVSFGKSVGGGPSYRVQDMTLGGIVKVQDVTEVGGVNPGPVFDGYQLLVTSIPTGFDESRSGWVKGASSLLCRPYLFNGFLGTTRVTAQPVPYDYELTIESSVVDTSVSIYDMPATPMKFQVVNTTTKARARVLFADNDGNYALTPLDEVHILEADSTGSLFLSWGLLFIDQSASVPPVAGDQFRFATHKPMTAMDAFEFGLTTNVAEGLDERPVDCYLSQNFPNPFNPSTVVSYQLPVVHRVDLRIFDLLGREVAMLVNEEKPPGSYSVTWDAAGMPSGIYFCRLTAGEIVQTTKMILMK